MSPFIAAWKKLQDFCLSTFLLLFYPLFTSSTSPPFYLLLLPFFSPPIPPTLYSPPLHLSPLLPFPPPPLLHSSHQADENSQMWKNYLEHLDMIVVDGFDSSTTFIAPCTTCSPTQTRKNVSYHSSSASWSCRHPDMIFIPTLNQVYTMLWDLIMQGYGIAHTYNEN